MVRVIEAKAALHAQPALVRRPVAAIHADDLVVPYVIGEQATHTTERAHGIDLLVDDLAANLGLGHEGTGGAGLHTLTAGHTAAVAHCIA